MTRSHFEIGFGGLLFIVVSALVLAAATYTQANMLFWAFGLMVGGLVVSFIVPWWMLRRLTVERLLPAHGVAGDRMVLRYRLVNGKRFLPVFNLIIRETWRDVSLVTQWRRFRGQTVDAPTRPMDESPQRLRGEPHGWVLHMNANHATQAEASCWPMRRGTLRFERVELSTAFPFGVVRRVMRIDAPDEVLVYPKLYRVNRRMIHRLSEADPTGSRQLEKPGGSEEFFGLRPYRPGDRLKLVDWRHTARTGKLVSREMTQPTPPRVMLLLDLATDADDDAARSDVKSGKAGFGVRCLYWLKHFVLGDNTPTVEPQEHDDPVERAISLAASLICDAHFRGYQIGLVVRGMPRATFPVHHSLPHRTRLLELFSGLDVSRMEMDTPGGSVEPTVIVTPGHSGRRGRVMVLGATDLDQWVEAAESERLLGRRTIAASRRQTLGDKGAA